MEDPIRKRIVIEFDDPKRVPANFARRSTPSKTLPRLWPKVVLVVVALGILSVMIAAVGGFFWWRYFQTTPGYTLAVMIDAVQKNDTETFDRQIDDESVARNIVATINDKAASQYGLSLNGPLRRQVDRLLPSLLPALRQRLHAAMQAEIKQLSGGSEQKPFILIALAVSRLATITVDGPSGRATAMVQNRKVELAMRLDNEQWKVVGFNDDVLTQKIVEDVVGSLPTIGGLNIDNILNPAKKQNTFNPNSH